MSAGNLINIILEFNRELDQHLQVMSALNGQVADLKSEIATNFSDTNVSTKLQNPLEQTSQSLSTAMPEVSRAKEVLFQLTAHIRG
ncbi:TPA: hypothetical protein ACGO35_001820 [Streptococcus suis]